jgi:hypothetical protein
MAPGTSPLPPCLGAPEIRRPVAGPEPPRGRGPPLLAPCLCVCFSPNLVPEALRCAGLEVCTYRTGGEMSEKPVRIAISVKDRVTRHMACGLFSSAGVGVQVCDDTTAILAAAEDVQAIVLELAASFDETIDALVLLRQRLPNMPIYVMTDAAGQRHAKRLKSFGVTEVIPHEELQRRVGHLVKEIAMANQIDDWGVRSPGWTATRVDEGYDVHSMDIGAWLSIPGNRRLLGLEESSAPMIRSADGPESRDGQRVASLPPRVGNPIPPAARLVTEDGAERSQVAAPSQGDLSRLSERAVGLPLTGVPAAEDQVTPLPCALADCPRLVACREEHKAQNAALLDTQIQREKRLLEQHQAFRERLQAELRGEFGQFVNQQIAALEAKSQQGLDERVRLGVAVATRRLHLMVGALAAVLAIVMVLGGALAWRWWPWS